MKVKKAEFLEYKLGIAQAELFMRDNIKYVNGLVGCESVRAIMGTCYRVLVNKGMLTAIEYLPIEHKIDLWAQAKEFAGDKLDRINTISLSVSLYTMEYFLNQL